VPPDPSQTSAHTLQPTGGRRHVVVVGAGVTGLVAARLLAAEGARVTVLEGSSRVGGQLRSAHVAGRRVDVGAESVFTAAPGPLALIDQLGLGDEVVGANAGTTWIWTARGIRPLPDGFSPAGPTRLAPLLRPGILSPRGMLRAAFEPFVPAGPIDDDVSVGGYLARRFGREVTDRLVDPLLGALHAGDVRDLSLRGATPQLAELARRHRSLLLGRRPRRAAGPAFVSLRSGMHRLAEQLAEQLGESRPAAHVHLDTRVTGIDRAGHRLRVHTADDGVLDADRVVLTIPAAAASGVVASTSPDAAAALGRLRTASAVVAALAYPVRVSALPALARGSGILVPSSSGRLLKAATFLSTKWPHYADDAVFLVRASAGRAGDGRAIGMDDAALVEGLHDDLAEATGLTDEPVDATVQRWPSTMPQLEVGHLERLGAIQAALARDLPGVVLAGAPYHGPGLAACLRSAAAGAARVTEEMHT
jgi:protoporphyrinogen/coproporphyrinogen III oxidase